MHVSVQRPAATAPPLTPWPPAPLPCPGRNPIMTADQCPRLWAEPQAVVVVPHCLLPTAYCLLPTAYCLLPGRTIVSRRDFLKGVLAAGTCGVLSSAMPGSAVQAVCAAGVTGRAPSKPGRWTPVDPPNQPIGRAQGIFPGRVVWIHDPKAAQWDGNTQERRLVRGQVHRPGPGRSDAHPVPSARVRREDGCRGLGRPVPPLQRHARPGQCRISARREGGREAQPQLLQPARRFQPDALQHAAVDPGPLAAVGAAGGRAGDGHRGLRRLAVRPRPALPPRSCGVSRHPLRGPRGGRGAVQGPARPASGPPLRRPATPDHAQDVSARLRHRRAVHDQRGAA